MNAFQYDPICTTLAIPPTRTKILPDGYACSVVMTLNWANGSMPILGSTGAMPRSGNGPVDRGNRAARAAGRPEPLGPLAGPLPALLLPQTANPYPLYRAVVTEHAIL